MLVLAAATAAITMVTPAGAATSGDTINGGCFFDTVGGASVAGNDIGDPNVFHGVIGDVSATQEAAGLPTDAIVSCKLVINNVDVPGTTFSYSGFGAQAGIDRVSYTNDPAVEGSVFLCERVVYADGTDTGWGNCGFDPCSCPPPQLPLINQLNAVLAAVNDAEIAYVDPQVCPILAANPGTYGPVTIRPDGDVYLADPLNLGLNPFWDCPPYGNYSTNRATPYAIGTGPE